MPFIELLSQDLLAGLNVPIEAVIRLDNAVLHGEHTFPLLLSKGRQLSIGHHEAVLTKAAALRLYGKTITIVPLERIHGMQTATITSISDPIYTDAQVSRTQPGLEAVQAEFQALEMLHSHSPELFPSPIAFGSYQGISDTHYICTDYRHIARPVSNAGAFVARLADLHRSSQDDFNYYGWATKAYSGYTPQMFPLSSSWERCFSMGLLTAFRQELTSQGRDQNIHDLGNQIIRRIVPRLLRPLESDGRNLLACLVHGNLQATNMGEDDDGQFLTTNPTPLFAHHEYELGPWFSPRYQMAEYIHRYTQLIPPSEPKEEFEDRGLLYSLFFDLRASEQNPDHKHFREIVKASMRKLINKYSDCSSSSPLGEEDQLFI
ncbi:Fructosamine kinase-domain-containing protein [Xylariales sp. PMI_506]|nr:Fructosamine kinase-domain-containing protein [Xylariales sp. PMI_506]